MVTKAQKRLLVFLLPLTIVAGAEVAFLLLHGRGGPIEGQKQGVVIDAPQDSPGTDAPPRTVEEVTRLLERLRSGAPGEKVRAYHLLQNIDPRCANAADVLRGAMGERDSMLRWAAAAALWRVGPARLVQDTFSPDEPVREGARTALFTAGDPSPAVPHLAAALGSDSAATRKDAAHMLSLLRIRAPSAWLALKDALRDADPRVRAAAGEVVEAVRRAEAATRPVRKPA